MLVNFHWKYQRESVCQLACLQPGLHLTAQKAPIESSPASSTVGDYTQRPHLWLIFTSKLSTPPASVAVDASGPPKLWLRVLLAGGARPDDGGWLQKASVSATLSVPLQHLHLQAIKKR